MYTEYRYIKKNQISTIKQKKKTTIRIIVNFHPCTQLTLNRLSNYKNVSVGNKSVYIRLCVCVIGCVCVCVCCVKQMQFSREQYNYNQINRSLSDEGDGPVQWCSLDNRQIIIVRRNRFNYRYRLQIFRHTDCDPVETGLY